MTAKPRPRGGAVEVDLREYYLDAVERVLGVLVNVLTREGAAA